MIAMLFRNWGMFLLRGLGAVLFAMITFSWPLLTLAMLAFWFGVYIFAYLQPGITIKVLLYLLAAWAILTGAFRVIIAILLRRQVAGEWALALSGLLGVLVGVLLFPSSSALVVMWTIGTSILMVEVLPVILGIRLRKLQRQERRYRDVIEA